MAGPATLRIRDAGPLAAACAALRRGGEAFDAPHLRAMARADPGHDDRLDPAYRSAIVPFYASSVLGERAAAVSCARAAATALEPLRAGFAAQGADEERHAALDEARLSLLGVDPAGAAEIAPGVAREMDASLEVKDSLRRMFLTNFVGEAALAAATFPFVVALARANGDRLSAALNRARLADEVRHVRFATRTLEMLVGQDGANLSVLQAWQDAHFREGASAFLEEVVPALEAAPNRPAGDWVTGALAAYRRRAARLGLRPP